MRRGAFLLLLLAAPLAQASLSVSAPFPGVPLDLGLPLVAAAGMAGGIWLGALAGFVVGVACGVVGDAPLGALALGYLAAGWLAGVLGRRGWSRSVPTVAAAGAICAALLMGVEAAVFHALGMGRGGYGDATAPFVATAAALTVSVLPLARWLLAARPAENPRPMRRKRLARVLVGETIV